MQALLIFLSTRDVVSAAAAIMNLRGGGKRIAKVATSRGRWCGPHNTSGQGCRCSADRGHKYSRLHFGIPLWKTTVLSEDERQSAAAGYSGDSTCSITPATLQAMSTNPGTATMQRVRRTTTSGPSQPRTSARPCSTPLFGERQGSTGVTVNHQGKHCQA